MRTVRYKQVLKRASVRWTGERDASQQDADLLNVLIDGRAREFWESYWWPELMRWEERQFRQDYNVATTYGAATTTTGVEVYYPPAKKYYQSLHAANVGNLPATLTGGTYVENSAHWAECGGAYSGEDWATGTTYTFTAGTPWIVRNPADGRFYQLRTTHTAGATLDATKFGLLTVFVRSIDGEQSWESTKLGEVRRVWPNDPRVNAYWMRGRDIPFEAQGSGIVVSGILPKVWVEFRTRPNTYTGEVYDTDATYDVDDLVYYDTEGDWFLCLQGPVTPADLTPPGSDASVWERKEFPYVLEQCVAQAAFADCLRTEKDTEGFMAELAEAMRLREVAVGLAERQQREQLNVVGR